MIETTEGQDHFPREMIRKRRKDIDEIKKSSLKFKMNHNLTKVRPLFTLSHRGSDNSPSSELCMNSVFVYYVMISINQIAYFNAVQYF